MKNLTGILILIISAIAGNLLIETGGVSCAILPIVAAAGAGALLKGVSSLFGDSEEEKRNKVRRRMLQAIRGQQEANMKRAETDKANANRDMSSEKADRRNVLSQKLAQYGYEPGGSIATNEKDLVLGNMRQKENIMAGLNESNQLLDKQYGDINAGMEDNPDPFSTFLGEAIGGANEGIKFGQALGFLDPQNNPGKSVGGTTTTNTTMVPTKYDTPVTNPEVNPIINPIDPTILPDTNEGLLGDAGMRPGAGGMGFEMDPMLSDIPDYSSIMGPTGWELTGYKNPFKKLRIKR